MTVVCFIRYEIDPFQLPEFARYCAAWKDIIPRLGGHLLGYFLPHEGSNYEAFGLIGFPTLANYEAYRQRLKTDAEAQKNFAFAHQSRLIQREERSFLSAIESTLNLIPMLAQIDNGIGIGIGILPSPEGSM